MTAELAVGIAALGLMLTVLTLVAKQGARQGQADATLSGLTARLTAVEGETREQSRQLVAIARAVAVIEAIDERREETGPYHPLGPGGSRAR